MGVEVGITQQSHMRTSRSREESTEEGLSSMISDSANKRQKVDRKIDIADRVSHGQGRAEIRY